MRNRRKIRYKITAAALISSMLGMSMAGSALAGPPAVATDEALYVNLDYYGNQVDSSVVKGVSLNGLRTFTDYGNYTDVTNMSNYAEPVISGDGVTWQLPEDSKERFYYECQLNNDEVILPWNFDVSYKLMVFQRKQRTWSMPMDWWKWMYTAFPMRMQRSTTVTTCFFRWRPWLIWKM